MGEPKAEDKKILATQITVLGTEKSRNTALLHEFIRDQATAKDPKSKPEMNLIGVNTYTNDQLAPLAIDSLK
jgi:hypothetical protein